MLIEYYNKEEETDYSGRGETWQEVHPLSKIHTLLPPC